MKTSWKTSRVPDCSTRRRALLVLGGVIGLRSDPRRTSDDQGGPAVGRRRFGAFPGPTTSPSTSFEHYIDPSYRLSSLWAFARYVVGRRRGKG